MALGKREAVLWRQEEQETGNCVCFRGRFEGETWKSETSRCLRKFAKSALPVDYFGQKKALMTGEIMDVVLMKLNRRLSRSNRSILQLMDNAGCHPKNLAGKFSNIKVCFLPANTTSKLQPLDLGIIQNFKVHYRHFFLRYVLSKIDECDTASDVVKCINILIALRWVAKAWSLVRAETIAKCFSKAGILNAELDVISCDLEEEDDPFLEADMRVEVQSLIEKTMPTDGRCNVDEYLNGDDDLPVCMELDSDSWEADFLKQEEQEVTDEEEDKEDEMDVEPPPPKLQNFMEAVRSLEDVQQFLESRRYIEEAFKNRFSNRHHDRLKLK